MSLSTNMVSGLSSGFDWRSMIDELLTIEHRRVDLVADKKTEYESKLAIFQTVNTKLLALKTQAETLASSNTFNEFTSSLSTNSTAYSASDFLSVTTSTSAAPGSHTVEMDANSKVAQARILSSQSFTSYDTALSLSGEFVINGRAAKIETSDDLNDIRNKIDSLNIGINATGVTASLMTVSSNNYRLILTSENTGKDAFTIFDTSSDAEGILSSGLGLSDGTVSVKNLISNGVRSEAFSSSSQSVATMLGITTAQSGTVTIGKDGDSDQFTASIDLSQSLTQIASAINTAAGGASSNIAASVVATTTDGIETYRLEIQNATQFGNAANDGDANNVLQALGFLKGGNAAVSEIHDGSVANTASAANIISTTYWDQFDATIADGDTVFFSAINHIGETLTGTYTIDTGTGAPGDGDQVQALLTAIEAAFTVQNASYEVTASIVDGKINITDNVSGDSQLSLTVVANNEGNDSNLDFGTVAASTEGYMREVKTGQDANITIDGTAITSSSNIIDDVIAGVTLNLLTVEAAKTVNLTISRDYDTIKSSVQGLLDSYNDILAEIAKQTYYDEDTQTAGPLQGDSTLSSIKADLQRIVVSTITGLPTTINALSLIGINSKLDYSNPKDNGQLSIDDDLFKDALDDNFHGLRRIFVAEGSTTDGDVEYIYHTNETIAGTYDISISQVATQASATGTTDLSSGPGAAETLTITDTVSGRAAEIVFDGSENSLTEIVNDINSELSTEYTEVHYSDTANNKTAGAGGGTITNLTKWSEIDGANVNADDTITVSGTMRNGSSVEDTHTITDTDDTIQGFLSFVETLYQNEMSVYLDANGKLVLQDTTAGDSQLSITITENNEGGGSSLDFGTLNTGNTSGVEGRYALDITASASGNNLQITHDNYGSSNGFTLSQNLSAAEQQEIYTSDTANTIATSEGKAYVVGTTQWNELYDTMVDTGDTISISGFKHDGTTPVSDTYSIYSGSYKNIDSLLTYIEDTVFTTGEVDARMENGKIIVEDLTTGDGNLSITLTANNQGADSNLNLGTIAQSTTRDTHLGLVNGTHSGLDVQGTVNSESASGSGRVLTGDAPGTGQTTSVEGLTIHYTGSLTGDQGSVEITMGIAELFDRILYDITNMSDGYLDYRLESMTYRRDDLEDNIIEMEARLNRKMEVMINRFVAMEMALSRIQNQSDWLTGQVTASMGGWV